MQSTKKIAKHRGPNADTILVQFLLSADPRASNNSAGFVHFSVTVREQRELYRFVRVFAHPIGFVIIWCGRHSSIQAKVKRRNCFRLLFGRWCIFIHKDTRSKMESKFARYMSTAMLVVLIFGLAVTANPLSTEEYEGRANQTHAHTLARPNDRNNSHCQTVPATLSSNRIHFSLLFLLALCSRLTRARSPMPETFVNGVEVSTYTRECSLTGGICVHKNDCAPDQMTYTRGLCGDSRFGIECCYQGKFNGMPMGDGGHCRSVRCSGTRDNPIS